MRRENIFSLKLSLLTILCLVATVTLFTGGVNDCGSGAVDKYLGTDPYTYICTQNTTPLSNVKNGDGSLKISVVGSTQAGYNYSSTETQTNNKITSNSSTGTYCLLATYPTGDDYLLAIWYDDHNRTGCVADPNNPNLCYTWFFAKKFISGTFPDCSSPFSIIDMPPSPGAFIMICI